MAASRASQATPRMPPRLLGIRRRLLDSSGCKRQGSACVRSCFPDRPHSHPGLRARFLHRPCERLAPDLRCLARRLSRAGAPTSRPTTILLGADYLSSPGWPHRFWKGQRRADRMSPLKWADSTRASGHRRAARVHRALQAGVRRHRQGVVFHLPGGICRRGHPRRDRLPSGHPRQRPRFPRHASTVDCQRSSCGGAGKMPERVGMAGARPPPALFVVARGIGNPPILEI